MERRTQPEVGEGEQGYLLLAMVVMVSLVLIALAVAAPVVARDLRRDKEVESMHRQQEYVRALRLYYRKFKSYPPSMDALEKSNNVRYLRKQYIDPLTGKADWRIIHVGENQTTVKGFFGEPLGGISSTGIGGGPPMSPAGGTAPPPANTPCNALAAGICDPKAPASPSGNTGNSLSSLGSGGVGQIMGVGSARSGDSILTPNEQATYDTWEFLYDPRIELMYAKSNILGGGGLGSGTGSGTPASTSLDDLNKMGNSNQTPKPVDPNQANPVPTKP